MIRLGAATHSFDQNQRFINMTIHPQQAVENGVTVYTPKNGGIAPPGHYMLFIVSNEGVPSNAKYIVIE